MDPQTLSWDVLHGNASQCMKTSPITVKQTIIYNTGHELYAISRLISCCCSENFIDLHLQNAPISRQWFSFNSWCKLRNGYLLIGVSQKKNHAAVPASLLSNACDLAVFLITSLSFPKEKYSLWSWLSSFLYVYPSQKLSPRRLKMLDQSRSWLATSPSVTRCPNLRGRLWFRENTLLVTDLWGRVGVGECFPQCPGSNGLCKNHLCSCVVLASTQWLAQPFGCTELRLWPYN